MPFPLLATRLLARSVFSAPKRVSHHTPAATQITRSFSVSSVARARAAAATKTKAPAKKAPAKKKPTKKTAKKPASKPKKAKKTLRTAKKPKKEVKKKVEKISIRPEDKPPKRPANNYGLFLAQYLRASQKPEGIDPKQYVTEKSKDVAAAWKTLSDEEKRSYSEQAAAALEEYKKKFEEYAKNTDIKVIKEINKRRVKQGKRKLSIKTGRPSTSGYILFAGEQRMNKPSPANRFESMELMRALGREWNALSDEEKKNYRERAVLNAERQKS